MGIVGEDQGETVASEGEHQIEITCYWGRSGRECNIMEKLAWRRVENDTKIKDQMWELKPSLGKHLTKNSFTVCRRLTKFQLIEQH